MLLFLLAAVAAQPSAAPSAAAPTATSPASKVDPAAVSEALRMLEEGGFEDEAMRGAMTAMELGLANLAEQIQRKAGEPAPADFLEKLRKIMSDHMTSTLRAKMGSIKQQAATIYAQEFTFLELRRIRELSTDPVMVKARERNKIIGPKLMALGAYSMRDAQPELEAKIQDLVADYLADQGRNPDQS